jgi:hypothetical protein
MAEFWHRAKVASEVALRSPPAGMDLRIAPIHADKEQSRVRRWQLILT